MTMLETNINALIAEHLGVNIMKVVPDAEFQELGADSLDYIEIAMVLDDELSIDIPDASLETVKTVGDLTKLVEELVLDNAD